MTTSGQTSRWTLLAGTAASVMTGFGNPTFSFTINDKVHPVTITAVADDSSQHIRIVATCSLLDEAP